MDDIEKEFEAITKKTDEWRAQFEKSTRYSLLSSEQKLESDFIIESFVSYMFNYESQSPDEWTITSMKSCCLEILPRKVSAGEDYYTNIAKVLEQFFLFLADSKLIENGNGLAENVIKIETDIIKAFENPANWGMAKSIMMPALEMGIDPCDEEEIGRYLNNYNNEQLNIYETHAVEPFKPGRNDKCPCGSGKKYKKCCGKG